MTISPTVQRFLVVKKWRKKLQKYGIIHVVYLAHGMQQPIPKLRTLKFHDFLKIQICYLCWSVQSVILHNTSKIENKTNDNFPENEKLEKGPFLQTFFNSHFFFNVCKLNSRKFLKVFDRKLCSRGPRKIWNVMFRLYQMILFDAFNWNLYFCFYIFFCNL